MTTNTCNYSHYVLDSILFFCCISTGFINIFKAKLLELNFFVRKTFLLIIKAATQKHPHTWPLNKPLLPPKMYPTT